MANSVDFKTANYFTGMPYLLGIILTPAGLLLVFSPQIIVGAFLLVAGIVIITTHYRLLIDYRLKVHIEYISIVGIKVGAEKKSFVDLQYLFVKKSRVSQTLNSRASSTTIQKFQYDGFLKFSEDDKLHLMTLENKAALIKNLKAIASKLKVNILDYSSENPVEIK